MSSQRIVCWVAVLMAGTGLLDGAGRDGLHLLAGAAISYLCFCWYHADSEARGYRRSRWLSVAMVAFTAGALPYYLARSRARDERVRALLGYAGGMAVALLAAAAGAAVRA